MRVRRPPPLRMTTTAAGVPNGGEVAMKVTVIVGAKDVWARADVQLDDYDEANEGAILTYALMSAGDQVTTQWRDLIAETNAAVE